MQRPMEEGMVASGRVDAFEVPAYYVVGNQGNILKNLSTYSRSPAGNAKCPKAMCDGTYVRIRIDGR